jgi:nicotinamidase-related amidase
MDALKRESTALVLIDLQKGILGLPAAPIAAETVKSAAMKLVYTFRAAAAPVVFVRVAWSPKFADALKQPVDRRFGDHELPKNWSEFPAEFGITTDDIVITKHQWGAFYGTDLDLQLRRRGINTIVLAGIATNIGVESTARDAWERNYHLIFADGAISGTDAIMHDFSMKSILPMLGRVRKTEEITLR